MVAQRFIPLLVQDFVDLVKEDPSIMEVLTTMGPAVFGFGVQTYGDKGTPTKRQREAIMRLR
jgi:hypothetical protein